MARGGFFSRVGNVLRGIVAPFRPKPGRPPPGWPPPERPSPGPKDRNYRRIWDRRGGRGDYEKHLRTFRGLIDPIESDPREREQLWESYVRHMVGGEGAFRRQDTRNMFWRDSGIDPRDFHWRLWREAMGYTDNQRGRTP